MLALVVASAALAGVLGDLLHALGGRGMPASEANAILITEPFWAALLTALLLGERRGPLAYVGGALLVGAGAVSTGPELSWPQCVCPKRGLAGTKGEPRDLL
jgi:drug/metabolite transporter (DMT)-like permease